MKIAIVTNFLYPEGLGGTELYCYQLAHALIKNGHEVFWLAPNFNNTETVAEDRAGLNVIKFAHIAENKTPDLKFIAESFLYEMRSRDIRVAHFNEFGGDDGIGTGLLAATKNAGIGTVVTLHLAKYICQTGTLHFGGTKPCNGMVINSRCSSCNIFSNRTPSPLLNLMLAGIFNRAINLAPVSAIRRIKRTRQGVLLKTVFLESLKQYADVVVPLTKWFKQVLLINGIEEKKMQHIPQASAMVDLTKMNTQAGRRNYVYVGRVNKEKGVDLVLEVSAKLKKYLPGSFIDIYGPYTPYPHLSWSRVENLDQYENIRYRGVVAPGEVPAIMNGYKAVLLPSRAAEMAPLVIMEANKLSIPVIASDVPGSRELIEEHDCGLVFQYQSADDMFQKILDLEAGKQSFNFLQREQSDFAFTARQYEKLYASVFVNNKTI